MQAPSITVNKKAYALRLTTGRVIAIRDNHGLDLIEIDDPSEFPALLVRPDKLAGILLVAMGSPAELTLEAFLEELDGTTLNNGYWALLEALTDFTQPAERGAALKAGIEMATETLAKSALRLATAIASPEVTRAIEKEMDATTAKLIADLAGAGEST